MKLEDLDVLKLAEEFEEEITSGLGLGNIHGMGNVYLFAQKVQDIIEKIKKESLNAKT